VKIQYKKRMSETRLKRLSAPIALAAAVAGTLWLGTPPAQAISLPSLGAASADLRVVQEINARRRHYLGYGYGYAYDYPGAYGPNCPPPLYGQYPLVFPEYVRGLPLRCCRPYYGSYLK
jgi:hypothetical protein